MPFFQSVNDVTEADKSAAEESMKAAHREVSCNVGELIAVWQGFSSEKVQDCIRVVYSSMPRNWAEWDTVPTRVTQLTWPLY